MHPRISIRPDVCHGKACVKGTRVPVFLVLRLLAGGDPVDAIVDQYPGLTEEDVKACLSYAAAVTEEEILALEPAGEAVEQ